MASKEKWWLKMVRTELWCEFCRIYIKMGRKGLPI
jgi:hypothetical protein